MYRMNTSRDIFKPGFLTSLTDDVLSGKPASDIKRLKTLEMARIPEIYANVDYSPKLFPTFLDEEKTILDYIEEDKVYHTGNKKEILGMDIKSITLLMYLKPRTAYWKPDKPQIYDTSVCGAVPLPLLGFHRWKSIPYSAWQDAYFDAFEQGWWPFEIIEGDESDPFTLIANQEVDEIDSINATFALDLMLGKTLASTTYNESTDQIELTSSYGLALLSHFTDAMWRPTFGDVRKFRAYNMGNHKGSYASAYNTAKIPEEFEGEEYTHEDLRVILHNKCSTPMRLLLSQRWAWYGNHRNTDMICDYQNWDNMPKNVDSMSTEMLGEVPQEPVTKLKQRFGIGVHTNG